MIGSTLQLSLNRAKISFLPCGTNEKFINLCSVGGPVEGGGWLEGAVPAGSYDERCLLGAGGQGGSCTSVLTCSKTATFD